MEIFINNYCNFKISTLEDIDSEKYVIKKYKLRYNFIINIVKNEIKINQELSKKGIKLIPKLLKVEEGIDEIKLYFSKIKGTPLSKLKFENLDFQIKIRIFYNILNLIKLLHLNNIVHNDLNLSNFILSDDNEVYIVDFALAEKLNDNNKHNDLEPIEYIIKRIFGVIINFKYVDIHHYIHKFGKLRYELLYKRRT